MKAIILTCRTIESEIAYLLNEGNLDIPVISMDPGLHETPDNLRNTVQEMIDRIDNVEFILLGYGICGNGLIGLTSKNASIVLPQFSDCIAMFLGSDERYRANLGGEMGAFFLTGGWLKHFNPRQKFYEDLIPKLGDEKAQKLARRMLANYKRFALVETEAEDTDVVFKEMCEQVDVFQLKTHRIQGTLDVLRRLVRGEWDEKFQIVPPGQKTEFWD